MKSSFESKKHQAILQQRLADQNAARLGRITGERAARILSNTLTVGECQERRNKVRKSHPEFFSKKYSMPLEFRILKNIS